MKVFVKEKGDIRRYVIGFAAKNRGSIDRFFNFHLFSFLFDSKVAGKMELVSKKP